VQRMRTRGVDILVFGVAILDGLPPVLPAKTDELTYRYFLKKKTKVTNLRSRAGGGAWVHFLDLIERREGLTRMTLFSLFLSAK